MGKGGFAGTDRSNDRDSTVQALLAPRNLLKSTGTRIERKHLSFPRRRGIEPVVNRGSSAKRSVGRFQAARGTYGLRPVKNDHSAGLARCLRPPVTHIVVTQTALLRLFCLARGPRY